MSVTSFIKKIASGEPAKPAEPDKKPAARPRAKKETQPKAAKAKPVENQPVAVVGDTSLVRMVGLTPLITEKSIGRQSTNQVAFRVTSRMRKGQIAAAFRAQYHVEPLKIRTMRMQAKQRTRGVTSGTTTTWKKAYITVADVKALKLNP